MPRDMDLLRLVMLKLEALPLPYGSITTISDIDRDFPIDGYTADQIRYHVELIEEARWIDTGNANTFTGFGFRRLTGKGHDFVDSVRDEKIWAMTKEGALKAGGITLDLVGALAKGFLKKQIEKYTDVPL